MANLLFAKQEENYQKVDFVKKLGDQIRVFDPIMVEISTKIVPLEWKPLGTLLAMGAKEIELSLFYSFYGIITEQPELIRESDRHFINGGLRLAEASEVLAIIKKHKEPNSEPDLKNTSREIQSIAKILDDWHDAASKADELRYFGHMTEDGIFLGTDATERWTVEEFRAYAHPHFSQEKGWTYEPFDRHIMVSPDGKTAWFDEKLRNKHLGELRGTGVLQKQQDTWKIIHYSMDFTIPNEITEEAVKVIRGLDK